MRWRGRWSLLAGALLGALAIAVLPEDRLFLPAERPPAADAGAERWACPMMDYIGTAPGTCPVCGMRLERMEAGRLSREQQRRIGLATVRVREGPALATVRASGVVAYDERVTQVVLARVAGRIVARHPATFGCCQEVAAGDPIVDLFSPEAYAAQHDLAAALAAGDARLAAAAEQRLERWNLAHVAAAVRAGRPPSDTVTILSPFAGQVWLADQDAVDRALRVGSAVEAGTPLLTIVDPRRRALVLQVPEAQAALLRAGQELRYEIDGGGTAGGSARIERVAAEIDPRTRTREVRAYLADAARLSPGATVQATIRAVLGPDLAPVDPAQPEAAGRFPLLPERAVLSTGLRHLAWRVRARDPDGSVHLEPVALALGPRVAGEDGEPWRVVRAGLAPGDEVVRDGAFLVDSQAQLAGTPSLLFPDGLPRPEAPDR